MAGKWDARVLMFWGVCCLLFALGSIHVTFQEQRETWILMRSQGVDRESVTGLLMQINTKLEGSRFVQWAQLGATLICAAFLATIARKLNFTTYPEPQPVDRRAAVDAMMHAPLGTPPPMPYAVGPGSNTFPGPQHQRPYGG